MQKSQIVDPISRKEAETIILHGSPEAIALALVKLAYFEPDWRRVQDICIRLSEHESKWVRRSCVTCFGHIARIRGKIETDKVVPVLNQLLADPEVKGEAEDTLEDFKVFLK